MKKYSLNETKDILDKANSNYSNKEIGKILKSIIKMTNNNPNKLASLFITNDNKFHEYYWNVSSLDARSERDIYLPIRTTYYFSESGSDDNDGFSENTPKKDFSKYLGKDDVNILLKCGDTFNMTSSISLGNNSMLSYYGIGDQPKLSYYQKLNVEWISTDKDNVYQADLSSTSVYLQNTKNAYNCNIGQILIDGKENWNRKVIFEKFDEFNITEWLSIHGEDSPWYIDWNTSIMYLYSESNPNERDIQYATSSHGISLSNISNTQVIGIEITGVGRHGISVSGCDNITLEYNYIHHIGGCILNLNWAKYGNGIEIWATGTNINVEHNFIEWCFDTGLTNQGTTKGQIQKNLLFKNNIIRNAFWLLESWGDGYSEEGVFENIVYESNLIANAMDVTKPEQKVYSSSYSTDIDENGNHMSYPPYISYRAGGYFYNQMCLISAGSGYKGNTTFRNNVGIGTNRFLVITGGTSDDCNVDFENNYLATTCTTDDGRVRFLRHGVNGIKTYPDKIPTATDTVDIRLLENDNIIFLNKIEEKIDEIAFN